jgi:hypothetical protein
VNEDFGASDDRGITASEPEMRGTSRFTNASLRVEDGYAKSAKTAPKCGN